MVVLSCILAISQGYFKFGGGDAATFAKAVAVEQHRPVAALVYDNRPIKPFQLPRFGAQDFPRDLNERTGWRPVMGSAIGLSRGCWTHDVYYPYVTKKSTFGLTKDSPDDLIFKSSLTVSSAPKTYFELGDLQKAPWPKPLKVHWFYQKMAVVLDAHDAFPATMLEAISKAVGGKFVETDKEFRIDFDAKEFRARTMATLAQSFPFDPERDSPANDPNSDPMAGVARCERTVILETIRALSDADLDRLFVKKGISRVIPAPKDSPLSMAVQAKLAAYEDMVHSKVSVAGNLIETYRAVLKKIDGDIPPRIYFSSPLVASVALGMKGGGTILL
ncbi:MAG TPA: hypothetical protein VHE55_13575 [Fimbriimonadaceae bacterium]|nr:hypothetical protein [Fimbriimonadaceae bacterium]